MTDPTQAPSKELRIDLENYCHCKEGVGFKCLPCRSRDEIERLQLELVASQREVAATFNAAVAKAAHESRAEFIGGSTGTAGEYCLAEAIEALREIAEECEYPACALYPAEIAKMARQGLAASAQPPTEIGAGIAPDGAPSMATKAPQDALPISSAPRTGKRVLLFAAVVGTPGKWVTGRYSCDAYRTINDIVIGAEEGFQSDADECIPSNQEVFTHWRPLPASPSAKGED